MLNPLDWYDILMTKDNENRYVGAGPSCTVAYAYGFFPHRVLVWGMDEQKELFDHSRSVINDWSMAYREGMNSNSTQAAEMGKLVIQSLLLLHGGAIIAIPNFIPTLVGPDKVGTYTFWIMFALFLLGLIPAVIAAALGFYVFSDRADGNSKMISWANEKAWSRVYGMQHATQYDENLDGLIKAADEKAVAAEVEALLATSPSTIFSKSSCSSANSQ